MTVFGPKGGIGQWSDRPSVSYHARQRSEREDVPPVPLHEAYQVVQEQDQESLKVSSKL
jgi:hypothetical protein